MRGGEGSEVYRDHELRVVLKVVYIYHRRRYVGSRRTIAEAREWVDVALSGEDPDHGR